MKQLAIWQPTRVWTDAGHHVQAGRLTCGCDVPIPPGHPVLRDGHNWPSSLRCPTHHARAAVVVVIYAKQAT